MGEHSVLYYSADAQSDIVSPGIFSPSLSPLFFFFLFWTHESYMTCKTNMKTNSWLQLLLSCL